MSAAGNGATAPLHLVAGATGFVGRRLVEALLADGARVRCLVRDAARSRGLFAGRADLLEADLDTDPDLAAAMEGVDCAYFLVHMLGRAAEYRERERRAAIGFATAAARAGVRRTIYLGGLGSDRGGSPHLDSRHSTAEALREHGPPLVYFRAGMIVGAGSESYELLRAIVARLPAVPAPGWLTAKTQPIGIRDVIAYLRQAPQVEGAADREIQIGGPDVVPYLDVIDRVARELGRRPPRRWAISDRIARPRSIAAGAATVTTATPEVAAELGLGLRDATVVTDPIGAELFDVRPEPLNVSVQRAIAEQERRADG